MYDIIGDVHGCSTELEMLLDKLGYKCEGDPIRTPYRHPDGRSAVFVGDMVDRGPNSPRVLAIIHLMWKNDTAIVVRGNHDDKFRRWLKGNKVIISHGMERAVKQLNKAHKKKDPITKDKVYRFLDKLPYRVILDNGKLLVCHAGLREKYHLMEENKKIRSECLYGVTTGKTDEHGFPERLPWQNKYTGVRTVVHGHVAVKEPLVTNNVYNVDTSCVYGGHLTALRYPEREFVQVEALESYWDRLVNK